MWVCAALRMRYLLDVGACNANASVFASCGLKLLSCVTHSSCAVKLLRGRPGTCCLSVCVEGWSCQLPVEGGCLVGPCGQFV